MDDDDLDNIDFMALDKLVEDHQAKAQVRTSIARLLPYYNSVGHATYKRRLLARCR